MPIAIFSITKAPDTFVDDAQFALILLAGLLVECTADLRSYALQNLVGARRGTRFVRAASVPPTPMTNDHMYTLQNRATLHLRPTIHMLPICRH